MEPLSEKIKFKMRTYKEFRAELDIRSHEMKKHPAEQSESSQLKLQNARPIDLNELFYAHNDDPI